MVFDCSVRAVRAGRASLTSRARNPKHDEPATSACPRLPASILSGNAMQFFRRRRTTRSWCAVQRNTCIIPLDGWPQRQGLEPMFDGDPLGSGRAHAGHRDHQLQALGADDFHYTNPTEFRPHSVQADRGAAAVEEQGCAVLRADDRRPKIFTAPWSQEFEICQARMEKDGLFKRVPGKQSLPRRQVRSGPSVIA
jgi:hypothetical protein